MSNLSDIRTDVQANWPANYHSSDLTNAKTDEFINTVQRRIQRIRNWTWQKQTVQMSTTDEERRYAVPTAGDATWSTEISGGTVRKFKDEIQTELINSDNARVTLRKRLKKQIEEDAKFNDLDDTGTPSDYCIQQDYIWLYHKPDHGVNSDTAWTINLEQYGYLPDLSSDTDTNAITNDNPEVLEYGATALGFRFGLDYESAEYWQDKADKVLAEMINTDTIKELASIESGMEPEDSNTIGV